MRARVHIRTCVFSKANLMACVTMTRQPGRQPICFFAKRQGSLGPKGYPGALGPGPTSGRLQAFFSREPSHDRAIAELHIRTARASKSQIGNVLQIGSRPDSSCTVDCLTAPQRQRVFLVVISAGELVSLTDFQPHYSSLYQLLLP